MRANQKLIVESATFGLGYAAVLIWIGSAFVGSFGDFDDAYPYWPAIKGLRTDTAGALAFAVAVVTLIISRYLQLRRRGQLPVRTTGRPPAAVAVQAVADVALVLATLVVIYLSANAAMHPWTLPVQLTHLLPWPSEGTVRVAALVICLLAAGARRYLRATDTQPAPQAAPAGPDRNGAAAHRTETGQHRADATAHRADAPYRDAPYRDAPYGGDATQRGPAAWR